MTGSTRQRSPLIWRLVEESLGEAAFLWQRLDRALDAPDHQLQDVERWVEERLLGALDGVRIAGAAACDTLLVEALQDPDAGAVASAIYVWATLEQPEALALLEERVTDVHSAQLEAVARGLGRTGNTALLQRLWARVPPGAALARAALLRAGSFCHQAPSTSFRVLLEDPSAPLRQAAAEALQFISSTERDRVLSVALASEDPVVRASASLASLSAGDVHGFRACVERIAAPSVHSLLLAPLMAALGGEREHAHLVEALSVPELRSGMLWALSFAGTKAAAEACLAQLRAGADSAQACVAFTAITGMKPQVTESQAADDAEQPAVPDVESVAKWWAQHADSFEPNERYMHGKPVTLERLGSLLESGSTQRRHAIAQELTARSGGAFCMQTFAFCRVQRAQQAKLAGVEARQLESHARALGARPLGSR